MSGKDFSKKLWKRAQDGDKKAFATLREEYGTLVRGEIRKRCYTISREDLLDMEQNIWIAVWKALPTFREKAAFPTWLVAVTKHHTWAWMRRQKAEPETLLPILDTPALPERDTEAILHRAVLQSALQKLLATEREVLLHRYYGQLSDEEIAASTAVPLGTVKSRIRAGLGKLRTEFAVY